MNKKYWLKGTIVIGLLAVGLLAIGLAKLNHKKEMMEHSVTAAPIANAQINKPLEPEKPYVPKKVDCPATLPDLEQLYKDAPRIKARWDAKTIGIVKDYKYSFNKGVLELKPGMDVWANTPINALSTTLYTGFNFPSLRGEGDENLIHDRMEYYRQHKVDKRDMHYIPETIIWVSINRVPDWSKLPITYEIDFWKTQYKPNKTAQQMAQEYKDYRRDFGRGKEVNPRYFADSERYGLKEIFMNGTRGLFFYEPINNTNSSPYGLPRFICDAAGRLGINGCVGHMKIDEQYLVTYDIPYEWMPCWQQVEEGVKRVLRFNTQAAN